MMAALLLMLCVMTAFSAGAAAMEIDMEHYLLVGADGWGLNEEGSARSDAIILASLDYGRSRITFTSFARDCIVKPSSWKDTVKINTLIRSAEGEKTLIRYIEEEFGLPISGYFIINFSGTVDLINAVGGVSIELTQDEADYVNRHAGLYTGYPLAQGMSRLNGAQALCYMRCRELDNDFGRQGRQGKTLRALVDGFSDITPLGALMLVDDVLGMYRTSLSFGQQFELAMKALVLRGAEVVTHSLPEAGTFRYRQDSHGASGLEIDMEANRAHLFDVLEIPDPFEEESVEPDTESMQAPASS